MMKSLSRKSCCCPTLAPGMLDRHGVHPVKILSRWYIQALVEHRLAIKLSTTANYETKAGGVKQFLYVAIL